MIPIEDLVVHINSIHKPLYISLLSMGINEDIIHGGKSQQEPL